MNKSYIVYMHKSPSQKKYIGITSMKINDRWRNGKGYKTNTYFTKAIKKYGWENFEHIILYNNLTKEEAEQKEIELIAKYKSNNEKYGYNIEKGGNTKCSNIKTKIKISKANKGKTAWNKNIKMNEEFCKKCSLAKKGKPLNNNLLKAIRKQVICIETNIIYQSILDASKKCNINVSNIAQVCKNKRKTAGNYHWKYVKGDD